MSNLDKHLPSRLREQFLEIMNNSDVLDASDDVELLKQRKLALLEALQQVDQKDKAGIEKEIHKIEGLLQKIQKYQTGYEEDKKQRK